MANGPDYFSPVSDEATNGKLQKLKTDRFPFLETEKRYEIEGWALVAVL